MTGIGAATADDPAPTAKKRQRASISEIEAQDVVHRHRHLHRHHRRRGDTSACNPVPRSTPITMSEVLLALDESREEREARIRKLFRFFDASGKGFLDHSDIEQGFVALDIPAHYKYAKDLLDVCDSNHDDRVDLDEFSAYMDAKELELYSIFRDIDVKHHGCIQPGELSAALKQSGIHLKEKELNQFVEHIDEDNNGIITFREWRDFLLLYPHMATIANIYKYWEKVSEAEVGEEGGGGGGGGGGAGEISERKRAGVEAQSQQVQAFKYFIAGGVAGALSRTMTAPLDRLKVLLQVERDVHHQRGRSRILPCVLKMYREDGVVGFFRGNGINVIKVAPESAIKFYSYEMMKDVVVRFDGSGSKEDISGLGRLFAGGTAGAIAQTAIYPMDLLKTRLQTCAPSADGRAPSAVKLSLEIWRQEGPRAFYRGLVPSLVGMIPYAGIDLAAYESLKNFSRQWLPEDHEPGPLIQVCCGMMSGALGATCVYPLQLVRTRLQAQPMNSSNPYTGMVDVFRRTFREEGLRAFYKGLVPNLLKVIPAASITYIAYEEMKSQLGI